MEEKTAVAALAALAQAARLRVFRALIGAAPDGLTPGALSAMLDVPASTLSFHLKELVHAGLVSAERDGRNLHYRPELGHMNDLLAYLTDHCCMARPVRPPAASAEPPADPEITMKRFHVHVHVDDLAKSIGFYSKLFAAEPTRVEADYAKWMLDDPRINFAISMRGGKVGIDHLGFQTDDAEELAALKARAEAADMALLDEGSTTCCYARSEKHWVTDPQGIAWEQFHTLGDIPVFSEAKPAADTACCTPTPRGKPVAIPVKAAGGCC